MAYGDFKGLPRRATSDKVLHDKAFNIVKNPKHDGCQRWFVSMVYKVFNKKSSGANAFAMRARSMTLAMRNKFSDGAVKGDIMSNQELAEELHKLTIRKF